MTPRAWQEAAVVFAALLATFALMNVYQAFDDQQVRYNVYLAAFPAAILMWTFVAKAYEDAMLGFCAAAMVVAAVAIDGETVYRIASVTNNVIIVIFFWQAFRTDGINAVRTNGLTAVWPKRLIRSPAHLGIGAALCIQSWNTAPTVAANLILLTVGPVNPAGSSSIAKAFGSEWFTINLTLSTGAALLVAVAAMVISARRGG